MDAKERPRKKIFKSLSNLHKEIFDYESIKKKHELLCFVYRPNKFLSNEISQKPKTWKLDSGDDQNLLRNKTKLILHQSNANIVDERGSLKRNTEKHFDRLSESIARNYSTRLLFIGLHKKDRGRSLWQTFSANCINYSTYKNIWNA